MYSNLEWGKRKAATLKIDFLVDEVEQGKRTHEQFVGDVKEVLYFHFASMPIWIQSDLGLRGCQQMKGRNIFEFCDSQMKEIVEHYLNNVMLKKPVSVVSIASSNNAKKVTVGESDTPVSA